MLRFKNRFDLKNVFNLQTMICAAVLAIVGSNLELQAQVKSVTKKRNTDLTFATGVKFTLQGTKVFNEFKLVDDLGLEYDLVSMLKNGDIRKELAVSDEEFSKLKQMKDEMTTALMPEIMKGMNTPDQGKMLEAKVKATELEFSKMLNPSQHVRLNQIRNQIRLERFGAAKLAQSRFLKSELQLSPSEVELTQNRCALVIKSHEKKIESWYQSANQKLIRMLSRTQQRKLGESLDDEFKGRWMRQKLFASSPKRRYRRLPKSISPADLLGDASIRKLLELTDSQINQLEDLKTDSDKRLKEQVDELLAETGKALTVSQRGKQLVKLNAENRKEFETKAQKVLLNHQSRRLMEIAVKRETAQMGTVQCICNGTIGVKLSISDEDAEKIYRAAREMNRTLEKKIDEARSTLDQEILQMLPRFDEAKMLGPPVQFDLR